MVVVTLCSVTTQAVAVYYRTGFTAVVSVTFYSVATLLVVVYFRTEYSPVVTVTFCSVTTQVVAVYFRTGFTAVIVVTLRPLSPPCLLLQRPPEPVPGIASFLATLTECVT